MRHTARTTSSSLDPQHAPRVRTKVLGWGQVYLVPRYLQRSTCWITCTGST
jgi:hypothetical protein